MATDGYEMGTGLGWVLHEFGDIYMGWGKNELGRGLQTEMGWGIGRTGMETEQGHRTGWGHRRRWGHRWRWG